MIDPWDDREKINYIINKTIKYTALGIGIAILLGSILGWVIAKIF